MNTPKKHPMEHPPHHSSISQFTPEEHIAAGAILQHHACFASHFSSRVANVYGMESKVARKASKVLIALLDLQRALYDVPLREKPGTWKDEQQQRRCYYGDTKVDLRAGTQDAMQALDRIWDDQTRKIAQKFPPIPDHRATRSYRAYRAAMPADATTAEEGQP